MNVFLIARRRGGTDLEYLAGPGEWTNDPVKAMVTADQDEAERECQDWRDYFAVKGWGDPFHVSEFKITELEAMDDNS